MSWSTLTALLALFAPAAGATLGFLLAILARQSSALAWSLRLWSIIFGPMLIVVAVMAPQDLGDWLLFSAICIGLSAGKVFRPGVWHMVTVVVGLLAAQSFESIANRMTFTPSGAEALTVERALAYASGRQRLTDDAGSRLWLRSWSNPDYSGESLMLNLSLSTGGSSGGGQNWFSRQTNFLGRDAQGVAFELLDHDSTVWQTYSSTNSLGGRTFRLSGNMAMNLIGSEPLNADCPSIVLRVDSQPWINSCAQQPDPSFPNFELVWTVPERVTENRLRIEVDAEHLGATIVTLTDFALYELTGGVSQRLYGLVPSEVQLDLVLYSEEGEALHTEFRGAGLEAETQSITMSLPAEPLSAAAPAASQLQLRVRIPAGAAVEVSDMELGGSSGWTPAPRPNRYGAWMNHPNVLAALLAPIALLIAVSRGSGGVKILGLALLFAVSLLTGSRVGFATLVLAVVLQIPALVDPRRYLIGINRWLQHSIAVLAVLVAVSGALVVLETRVVNPVDGNSVSRTEIWSAAAKASRDAIWTGWGNDSTEALNRQLDSPNRISHAHNWWLELALRYGIGGFVAGIWLTGWLLRLAVRSRSVYVLSGVILVLCANTVDTTLMTPFPWASLTLLWLTSGPGIKPATRP